MPETTQETYNRLQREASKAFQKWQEELHPPIGPDTEVWVSRTLETTKKMTIKDLALQIRVPVSELIKPEGSIKYAGSVVEKNFEWIDEASLSNEDGWEQESDFWSVTEVRSNPNA